MKELLSTGANLPAVSAGLSHGEKSRLVCRLALQRFLYNMVYPSQLRQNFYTILWRTGETSYQKTTILNDKCDAQRCTCVRQGVDILLRAEACCGQPCLLTFEQPAPATLLFRSAPILDCSTKLRESSNRELSYRLCSTDSCHI